ncbi:MAG TPA: hypothetical protein VF380_03540 [Solirubrobacteraceae bacterium]
MSLVPVPSEPSAAACANCGAALVADQRYCLTCGAPCSPVRLAFLDVLQNDQAGAASPAGWSAQGTVEAPLGYAPIYQEPGANGWLRRYSGLLGLLSVLLLCLVAGLLVGHWVTQGKSSSGPQVVKIEGLSGVPAAAAVAPTSTTPASSTPATSKAAEKEEAEESKEAAKETKAEKAPPPAPVKVTPSKLKKLSTSTGKQHQEEVNALGAQPIETG